MKKFCYIPSILLFVLILPTGLAAAEGSAPDTPAQTPDFSHIPQGALVPTTCFAEGTDADLIARHHERLQPQGLPTSLDDRQAPEGFSGFVFEETNRWSLTALSGGGLTQGDPTLVTWSIVPDGTSIFGFAGEPTAPSNLRAFLDSLYGDQTVWLPLVQSVFDRWSELNGVTYVFEPRDDGAPWIFFDIDDGVSGVRGDVRIAGHAIDGDAGILAYNFFPNLGDMVLDTSDVTFTDLSNDSRILRNTLAHEHGHGLGLGHVCPLDATKLMEPVLARTFDGPQFDDVLGSHRGYGDPSEANDTPGTATNLGALAFGEGTTLGTRSIDDFSDPDFYTFAVDEGTQVHVTVRPVGGQYLSGPQLTSNCKVESVYDAEDNQDLALELLDTDGTTVLASSDATKAGGLESVSLVLPGAGTYFIHVRGPDKDAQMYELDVHTSSATRFDL